MSNTPFEAPNESGDTLAPKTASFGRRLVTILAVVGSILLLIALLLPNVRRAREPSRRANCGSNLRNIALALRAYESHYHVLPPAYTVDARGKPLHSWRTLILPYLDEKGLYAKIDLSKPWDDPANKVAFETKLPVYRCVSAEIPATHTTYLAIVAPDSCLQPAVPRKLADIKDLQGSTLMVVDADTKHAVHWMSPVDVDQEWLLNLKWPVTMQHSGMVQATHVDGSVRTLSTETDPATLRAMISINGGDDDIAAKRD